MEAHRRGRPGRRRHPRRLEPTTRATTPAAPTPARLRLRQGLRVPAHPASRPALPSRSSRASTCRTSRAASVTTRTPPGPARSATSPWRGTGPPTASRSPPGPGARGRRVVVETRRRWFTYVVDRTQIVEPTDVWVIDPVPGKPGATPTERAAHPHHVQPALGLDPAADRLRPPRGEPGKEGRPPRRARPGGRGGLMYGWIWRHLPGPWPRAQLLARALVAAVVLLLFKSVFPWAEPRCPSTT